LSSLISKDVTKTSQWNVLFCFLNTLEIGTSLIQVMFALMISMKKWIEKLALLSHVQWPVQLLRPYILSSFFAPGCIDSVVQTLFYKWQFLGMRLEKFDTNLLNWFTCTTYSRYTCSQNTSMVFMNGFSFGSKYWLQHPTNITITSQNSNYWSVNYFKYNITT
jgi:hypothetical protein